MKYIIGDRIKVKGTKQTGTVMCTDSKTKTYFIRWDQAKRSTWRVEEDLERIEQTDDVPNIGVGKNYNPKGRTESAMIVMGDVLKEAYCSGYADGLSDRIKSDYDRGLHDAWEAARKICSGNFAGKLDTGMILNISASDAIEKIKEYEVEEQAKNWSDIPAEEMTENQLRQAVKDLRMGILKRIGEWT